MQRTKPPFRADHVGSLLRPAALKEAREKHARGEIDAAVLKAVEDREIERAIKKQEEVGLKAITDGEFRRSWWHLDFLWGLDGAERYVMEQGIAFQGLQTRAEGARIVGKLGFSNHPMLEHFKFVKAHTTRTPKITIPAPSALYGRTGRASVSEKAYPSLEQFFSELGAAYSKGVRAFADAGCRYLQLDEVFIAMLCDPNYRKNSRGARRRPAQARRALCRPDQCRDVGHPFRHDDHHASGFDDPNRTSCCVLRQRDGLPVLHLQRGAPSSISIHMDGIWMANGW